MICTDEYASYQGLSVDFLHKAVNHSAGKYVDGDAHTNGIESVWAVLKRGHYGVYHSISPKHLFRYVDEFVFRLNEGNCRFPTIDRMGALIRGAVGKRLTYRTLTQQI